MPEKVIDFNDRKSKRKKSGRTSIFSVYYGPRAKVAIFFTVLFAQLLLVALVAPGTVTSPYFAFAVILIAVISTAGSKKLRQKYEVNRMYREMMERKAREEKSERDTFH